MAQIAIRNMTRHSV